MKPARPALRYFGGKWRLAPWIISHFPPHICYAEPFCGAASVFLQKPPAQIEVINDVDGELINFFRVLRDRPDDLIRAILLTPYSRTEYNEAWDPVEDPLERARRRYLCAQQGWGSHSSSWCFQHSNIRWKSLIKSWNDVRHLPAIVWRLKQAFIECDDALAIIDRYDQPHTLFYIDPPYLLSSRPRYRHGGYLHEVDEHYHRQLLDKLQNIQGMTVISGYPSELYRSKLAHWHRVQTKARTTQASNLATEVLWLSPSTTQRGQPMLMPMQP